MGLLLNIAANILTWILRRFCWAYGAIASLKKREFNDWNSDIAYAKDVTGNVYIKYIGNDILITKKSLNKFGKKRQTVSAVLGFNKAAGTLTYLGSVVDGFLEFLDPGHTLNAAGIRVSVKAPRFNKMLWLYITGALYIIFGVLTNWYDWAVLPMFISLAYPFELGIVMIFYAFVINPINNLNYKHY